VNIFNILYEGDNCYHHGDVLVAPWLVDGA